MEHFNKVKGITTRQCSGCGGDLGNRYKSQRYCNECHAKYMRDNRPKHSELTVEQREKATARAYAREYLKRGKITKQPCEDCGNIESEIHHSDYSKPLLITWLCRSCHLKRHK